MFTMIMHNFIIKYLYCFVSMVTKMIKLLTLKVDKIIGGGYTNVIFKFRLTILRLAHLTYYVEQNYFYK